MLALGLLSPWLLASPPSLGAAETSVFVEKAAAEIDRLVAEGLMAKNLVANPALDDERFLRRAYLDIAGRIPTIEEGENFLGSTYERKREQLIADLLESEGHVSHSYNFWADILRINRGLNSNAAQADAAYQLWLKEALAGNLPYDQFVRELVSATGKIWENGAIGYYIRDRGMPLDNMSNTVRVFLGTRLECAQCHDHPFDEWTQMDYYQMAAFSFGMSARSYDAPNRRAVTTYQQERRTEAVRASVGLENFPVIANRRTLESIVNHPRYGRRLDSLGLSDKEFRAMGERAIAAYESFEHGNRMVNQAIRDLYDPLRYIEAVEQERALRLPHDYAYDDAKPGDTVEPATMFGEVIDPENLSDSTIEAYAEWMTSKENPTFTRVIANRLWKRAFGHGVFEPVDELTSQTYVSNPELLAYLEGLMRELDYDMRRYLEILYNTSTYQREAYRGEVELGEAYHFPGPVLRRMSAEQIWDSIVALALPEADVYRPRLKNQVASVERLRRIYYALEDRSEEDFIEMVDRLAEVLGGIKEKEFAASARISEAREAGDDEAVRLARNDLNEARREARRTVARIGYENTGEGVDADELLLAMGMESLNPAMLDADGEGASPAPGERVVLTDLPRVDLPEAPEELRGDRSALRAWQSRIRSDHRTYTRLVAQMARASEQESPARRGHFLREFGQSDREVIENAAFNASVPQALNLLNGPMVEALTNEFAVFGRRLALTEDPEERIRLIFQGMLTREPTETEWEIARAELEAHGDSATENLVWALLNTRQFLFVQ